MNAMLTPLSFLSNPRSHFGNGAGLMNAKDLGLLDEPKRLFVRLIAALLKQHHSSERVQQLLKEILH